MGLKWKQYIHLTEYSHHFSEKKDYMPYGKDHFKFCRGIHSPQHVFMMSKFLQHSVKNRWKKCVFLVSCIIQRNRYLVNDNGYAALVYQCRLVMQVTYPISIRCPTHSHYRRLTLIPFMSVHLGVRAATNVH